LIDIQTDYTRISGFELQNIGTPPLGGGDAAIRVEAVGVVLERLLIHDVSDPGAKGIRAAIEPETSDFTIRNCVLWNVDRGIQNASSNGVVRVEHSTILDSRLVGIDQIAGTIDTSNVLVAGRGIADSFGTIAQTNNVSSDGTAVGLSNQDLDMLFVAPRVNPPDFHLSATSPAREIGTPGTGNDIDGDSRPSGQWDVGADER
jgi:hypothetical protein